MSKTVWGNATWFLMHTLSIKLKPEHESKVPVLFNIFSLICSSLPCPVCQEHAMQVLRTVDKRRLATKDSLIGIIHQFHNMVNKRLGKPEFSKEEHDALYVRAKTGPVINNFINVYNQKHGDEKAMLHAWTRLKAIRQLKDFLNKNPDIFFP